MGALVAVSVVPAMAADIARGEAQVTTIFDHPLPSVPGKSLRGVLVEYGPGGSSPPHTHAASAFITATVIEGAVRSDIAPDLISRLLFGMVNSVAEWHRPDGPVSPDELAASITALAFEGLDAG